MKLHLFPSSGAGCRFLKFDRSFPHEKAYCVKAAVAVVTYVVCALEGAGPASAGAAISESTSARDKVGRWVE